MLKKTSQFAKPTQMSSNPGGTENKKPRIIKWDEEAIAEHDKERGSRYNLLIFSFLKTI